MKFFIASHSQIEAMKLRAKLIKSGHEVTSRWITEDTKFHKSINAYTDEERTRISERTLTTTIRSTAAIPRYKPHFFGAKKRPKVIFRS